MMLGGGASQTITLSVEKKTRNVVRLAAEDPMNESLWRSAGIRLTACDSEGKRLRKVMIATRPSWLILGEGFQDRQIIAALVDVRRAAFGTKVAVLGLADDFGRCERWVRHGVACYLASSSTDDRIIRAMNLSDEQDLVIIDACFHERLVESVRLLEPQASLSARELELLKLAAEGLRTREIAAELHLTGHTVEFHFRNIISKLGVRNRAQAVARAVLLGLITAADGASWRHPPFTTS
jgi:DNA-binding NarL/FixJ family response regulator